MKLNRHIQLIVALMLLSATCTFGQGYDEQRMDRDLKIAANILTTLSSGEDGSFRFYNKVEGNYIPDYGVIFSLPKTSVVYGTVGRGRTLYTTGSSVVVYGEDDEDDEDARKKEAKVQQQKQELMELKEKAEKQTRQVMIDFLADYADLIGQLKPTDRVVVQSQGRNERIYAETIFVDGQKTKRAGNSGLSAQVLKSDISAYKEGKLSRDAFEKKIEFTTGEDEEVAKDIRLFSSIFARLYEPDISTTYYTSSRTIGYTQLANFGITFNMKVYSSSSDNGLHTIRTTGESGLTQDERNVKVNAMYPDFKESFKENLLDYGRTIKSIKPDEMIVFKVALTECKGCDMPEKIEVTVKGSTLKDYDAGKLSRDKAMAMITVKEKKR